MGEFKCQICKKTFTRRFNLKRHQERKTPCFVLDEKESPRISENLRESPRISENLPPIFERKKKNQVVKNNEQVENTKLFKKTDNLGDKTRSLKVEKHDTFCQYCGIEIQQKRNLNRHLRNNCDKIPEKVKKDLIKKYNNNLKHKKTQSKSLVAFSNKDIINDIGASNGSNSGVNVNVGVINNNCQTNIQNIVNNQSINININPFGQESIQNIDKQKILSILDRAYSSIPHALKAIHYDIKENRNIFQPNKNKPYVKVFNGNKWIYQKIENVGENMITTMSDILEQWFQKYQEEISDNKQAVFQNLIDDYNDGNLEERFNEEFKLFLMNYSDEIKKYIADKISIEIDKGLDQIVNE